MISLLAVVLLLLLFALNAPIAVAVGAAASFALWLQGDFSLMLVVQRMYGGADSFPLMAVPLFMIAGLLMEEGGVSERLVALAQALVGWLPAGLAAVTIVAAMFFAGISGSAAADTAAVGGILIPAMIRGGYDKATAGAVQAAAGSIGVIIPPSIPMIIFGFLTGASIGKLFAAGVLPGLLMGFSLIVTAAVISGEKVRWGEFDGRLALRRTKEAFFALAAPAMILGGILGGVFTATESAAVAVFYGLFAGFFVYRKLKLRDLPRICVQGAVVSAGVMFIISAATVMSWYMTIENIPGAISGYLLHATSHKVLLLLIINGMLLLAGAVVETTAALILFVPLLLPLLPALGMSEVQLGAVVVVNLAIGMLTPPLGICLIVSSSLAKAPLVAVSRKIIPFLIAMLVNLLLITYWPPLTTWLPGLME